MGTNKRKQTEGARKATRKLGRSANQQGKARTAKLLGKKKKSARHTKKAVKLAAKARSPRLAKKTQLSKGSLKERLTEGLDTGVAGTIGRAIKKRKDRKSGKSLRTSK